ncbi:unnamed protein product [Meganyctiphanes norvegica]|uniref:STAS domain-containing protein n=1 Tax=Meganyctiphanes norvegica TaxID=48144 RepID=A0AAV2R1E6_MEGNR
MHDRGGETMADEVCVVRPALTVKQRNKDYYFEQPQESGVLEKLKSEARSQCECSVGRVLSGIQSRLPILNWLPSYSPKNSLLGDTISGTTVAIMHIPQGMAYALLASIPPICGMYMAFFPVLVYAFFGTSRHCSMGTFAVVCLMTGKVVNELATFEDTTNSDNLMNLNNTNSSSASEDVTFTGYTPVQVATTVAFMCGIWQIVLGMLQLGVLSVFLSDMLVSGFTTGAAIHVMTSQIKYIFGIKVARYNGPLKIIYTYRDMFGQLFESNPASMITSLITISVLVFNNEVLKPRLRKKTPVPIPIELIAVVLGTVASYFGDLNGNYDMRIVGKIPTGLPPPEAPPFDLIPRVVVDSFVITIVAYTVSYSMSKIFGKRHNYPVDATQELYALGISNIVGSFFSCAPIAASLSRSLIQESVGGVTQIASFICCGLMLLVLLFIGPVFETLPNCVLSSLIVVALKGMFMQFHDLNARWKISKIDSIIWISSFLGVVIVDIDYGLVIGIIVSLFVLLARNQKPVTARLGHIPNTDIYLDKDKYSASVEVPGVMIFQFSGSVHFANIEYFRNSLFEITRLDPNVIKNAKKAKLKQEEEEEERSKVKGETDPAVNGGLSKKSSKSNLDLLKSSKSVSIIIPDETVLILELSGMSSVDSSGAKFLAQLYKEYKEAGITLAFSQLSECSYETLERCGSLKTIDSLHIFHSIQDAVVKLVPVVKSSSSVRRGSSVNITNSSSPQHVVSSTAAPPSNEEYNTRL